MTLDIALLSKPVQRTLKHVRQPEYPERVILVLNIYPLTSKRIGNKLFLISN